MQQLILPFLSAALLVATASAAPVQVAADADAQQAMEAARAAYQAEDFPKARDLARKASETDPNNPEVHLLLGMAHYQLGELDEAIAAWKRTLRLAPEQPYAKRMLAVLRGKAAEIDVRIKLIEMMLHERLHAPAEQECVKLLSEKAPSDAQRAKVMTLQAESLVRMHKGPDGRRVLHELLTLYPQQADPAHTTLLIGEAKLQGDPQTYGEGLAMLKKLVADHPDTPAAARAEYDIIIHDPLLAAGTARADAMATWLAANPDHLFVDEGRRKLLDTYLDVTRHGPKPTAESDLAPSDVKALALAAQIFGQFQPADKANALTKQLLDHFNAHYTNNGAHAAAVRAMETLLAAPLPRGNRLSALRALLDTHLDVTRRGPKPTAESDLAPSDVKALALAAQIFGQFQPADKADALTKQLLDHFNAHYTNNGARAAAVRAMETFLAAPLPRGNRLSVLRALGSAKYVIAADWLDEQARAGQLPVGVARGQLPEKLTDVLATFEKTRTEYPAESSWIDPANLAKRVRASAAGVLPTAEFKGLSGPDAWALDIAMPVIKANGDQAAVKSAVETVQAIIQQQAKLQKPGSRKLAVDLSVELLEAISPSHPSWPAVIVSYYTVAAEHAHYVFQENIRVGRGQDNATLTEQQKTYLAILKKHLTEQAAQAPHAIVQLAGYLKPWVEHGHWAVAEQAYAAVADALPELQRRQADLAVVNLWIQQVTREHQRLVAAGLTVPRQLDPRLAKALQRCRQLQAGLEQEPATLAQVRAVWDSVVKHYKTLEYYDVAEAAIRVKADQPDEPDQPDETVEPADEYAAFQLALLKDEQARRELAQLLRQYSATEKITLTPAFKEVIAAWKQFIADRPTSFLVPQATERVFAIASFFEQHKAHAIAADIHGEFAEFADGVDVLSQSAPGTASVAQRAGFARATALDAQARKTLAISMADRKSDDPPPAKLSDEFAAAIAAYRALVEARPDSPLVGQAIGKVMAVAYEYAKVDAWDVADGVYAGLLDGADGEQWQLAIRRPERLEFCRGLCQLGRAMPEHAREILKAVTEGSSRGLHGDPESVMLAMTRTADTLVAGGSGRGPSIDQSTSGPAPTEQPAAEEPPASAAAPAAPPPADAPAQAAGQAGRDVQLLAMIRQQESSRAAQVAQLRERLVLNRAVQPQAQQAQQNDQGQQAPSIPVLSEAELTRQEKALAAAYEIFQSIRKNHPYTPTAEQARAEILVMVGHWRGLSQWDRSAALALRFLADNPTDPQLPIIRLEIARDRLAWATRPIEGKLSKQEMLSALSKRFDAARAELANVVADFPKEGERQQEAQWEIANSYLSQARVVDALSPTLARGQYVRTTKELRRLATKYPSHPRIGEIPQMLWNVAAELEARGYDDEAILAWNELTIHDPMHGLAQQAAMKIAETYHRKLKLPLRAAEAYQELNFARGGNDEGLQNAIFQVGSELKDEKRWVEALHVLETFVDSFPRHAQAGQALTMVGQIHQTNEAWEDAIAAYRRVIAEFRNGQFVQEAKWAIAECKINLSRFSEAAADYRAYVAAYPQDAKVQEANRRIEVLKDLARYQGLVDEEGQRKAFDAQYQIALIVGNQLSNPVKAIIEYRKVVTNWPASHLADDALYAVGTTYLNLGETEKAREALLQVAQKYAASPLADDALFMVGKSYEDEAEKLASVTRESTLALNRDVAQRKAYQMARDNLSRQQQLRSDRISSLKQAGKGKVAEAEEASAAANYGVFNDANVRLFAQKAVQEVAALTATQLADRQDKINAALRKAVDAYTTASKVAGADKADEALLQMATIYDQRLKDSQAAMQTWLEIVRQFSGTSVAEDASWSVAQYYQREGKYSEAIEAYQAFLRNYRRSPKAAEAQFAVAENYEHLGQWVNAMDSYTNYITNFPEGPLVKKAQEQINWIKTYRL